MLNSSNSYDKGYGNSQKPRIIFILMGLLILVVLVLGLGLTVFHKTPSPPQADQNHSTTFEGMSAFINNGLTTTQVNGILKAFSKSSPTAKNITVDPNSLSPGPHDPNKINPFTINFNLTIDSTAYKGLVSYSDLNSVRLTLFTLSGKQVFDSGVVSAQ